MKKGIAAFCALFIVLSVFSGCGGNKTDSAVSSSVSQSTASTAQEGTRIVSTVMGDIEVPVNPQRVVANWYVGEVIALNLNLVGYSAWSQETMPFYNELEAGVKLENWEPEDVMALEPDLIVTYSQEDFEKFNKVAPVLVVPEAGISSLERVQIIGDATGRSEEAKAVVDVFEAKLAAAKDVFKDDAFAGKTFSIMEDWGASGEWSGVAYESDSRGGTLVYTYLGLQQPQQLLDLIAETGDGRGTLSYEVAHEYFGDYILWFRQEGKESEYSKTDIWNSIPAVAEGRVVEIPGEYQGLFFYSDVLSLTAQLDYMVEAINSLA
ncbi:MAG: ABC transporter substrate-binding protein [Oscillospiraceae bacterium]